MQNDIKRVLAYSTVSQLGLMFLAMGVGAFGAGIFHLYTHAFFKALLFLGSGAVIHALHGEQDIRNMGGLRKAPADHLLDVPRSARWPLPASPAWPASSARTRSSSRPSAKGTPLLWVVGALTSLLTAIYMFRLVFLTFHGERRHDAPAARRDDGGTTMAHAAHARTARRRARHAHDRPARCRHGAAPTTAHRTTRRRRWRSR